MTATRGKGGQKIRLYCRLHLSIALVVKIDKTESIWPQNDLGGLEVQHVHRVFQARKLQFYISRPADPAALEKLMSASEIEKERERERGRLRGRVCTGTRSVSA